MTDTKGFRPRGLGEIAIRCADMAAMVRFYQTTIGLDLIRGGPSAPITFFRISDGFGGHTAVLALFDHQGAARSTAQPNEGSGPVTGDRSSLHHIALSLPASEQDAVIAWYEKIGQPYRVETFGWIGWRGIFTTDPEGNTVELVAYDPAVLDGPA